MIGRSFSKPTSGSVWVVGYPAARDKRGWGALPIFYIVIGGFGFGFFWNVAGFAGFAQIGKGGACGDFFGWRAEPVEAVAAAVGFVADDLGGAPSV